MPDRVFIDSAIIKVHRCSGGGKKGHGIGSPKAADTQSYTPSVTRPGLPLVLVLTPGNVHGCKVAEACLITLPQTAHLVVDKGYDSKKIRECLEDRGTEPVNAPRSNRKVQYVYNKTICCDRNVIERMLCRLKD